MNKQNDQRIDRTDMLMMLLYAPGLSGRIMEPIKGKTRLQKEVFLSQKELRKGGFFTYYPFRPYKYGPYSIELYDDIDFMESEGVLSVNKIDLKYKGKYAEFLITNKGRAEIEEKMGRRLFQEAFEIIQMVKKRYNDMNIVELVELTHKEYPEYDGNLIR